MTTTSRRTASPLDRERVNSSGGRVLFAGASGVVQMNATHEKERKKKKRYRLLNLCTVLLPRFHVRAWFV